LERAETGAGREAPGAHLRVLRLGARAVAAAPVDLAEEEARLAGAVGARVAGHVRRQRLLVGGVQRLVVAARDVEGAEAIVGGFARSGRLGELLEERGEALRRLALFPGVQPAAGVEVEDLRTMPRASRVLHGRAHLGERRHVGAPAAVDRELRQEEEAE